jgi:L-lactate dehydrogenase complex protein LldE
MMGRDRIYDHEQAGTEVLTAGDMSCLMHLEGLLRREKKAMRVMHVAEVMAEGMRVPARPAEEEMRRRGEEEILRVN